MSVCFESKGAGDLNIKCTVPHRSLVSETYELEDCLKVGISSSETWHNINNSNTMSVSDGVATGYNRLLDYNWDNSIDWEVSCSYKCNNQLPNGLIFADVTNTNNYDKDCFEVFQGRDRSYLEINGNTNGSNWGSQSTSYQSRQYNTIRVTNINGELSFYINNVLQRTHSNIPAITNICIGLYTWQNGTGSFKDLKIKAL